MSNEITYGDIDATRKILRVAFNCARTHGGEHCTACKADVEKMLTWLESKSAKPAEAQSKAAI